MWRPRATVLIDELQRIVDVHGDLEVVGYCDTHNEAFNDVEPRPEKHDGQPVIMLIMETEAL